MTYEFKLPDIGEGVVEGEVVRWLVKEGDVVREDQPLVEIMTDKATVEIPAPRAGTVGKRMYAEGQICPVGKVLITIELDDVKAPAPERRHVGDHDRDATSAAPSRRRRRPQPRRRWPIARSASAPAAPGRGATHAVLATPATRKLARELSVDIRLVQGTGPAGRITSDNVRAHQTRGAGGMRVGRERRTPRPPAAAGTARQPGDVRLPFRGVRKKIAERLVHSKHTAAHFTYVEEIDCTDLVQVRAKANARLAARGIKLSYLPFIIKATVEALQKFPQLNATLDEAAGEIVQRGAHHIGLATATDSGLIVPVIRDAGRQVAARPGWRDRPPGRGHPVGQGHARGSVGLHLHHHQPGAAGRAAGHAHHQLSRGGHPGRAQDRQATGRGGQRSGGA